MTQKITKSIASIFILATLFQGCGSNSTNTETTPPSATSQYDTCTPTTNTIYQYVTSPKSYKYAYLGKLYDVNISTFPHTIQKDYDINITFFDENQTFSSPLYTLILDKNETERKKLFYKLQISDKPFNFIELNNGRILVYEEVYFLSKKSEKILKDNFITPNCDILSALKGKSFLLHRLKSV